MRKHTPLQWIEQAEARQVITAALSEAPAAPAAPSARPVWTATYYALRARLWGNPVACRDHKPPTANVITLRR